MSPNTLRNKLLGISTYMPSDALAAQAKFSDANEYAVFLKDALKDRTRFWLENGSALNWVVPPESIGEPQDWFKGAKLRADSLYASLAKPDGAAVSTLDPETFEVTEHDASALMCRINWAAAELDKFGIGTGERVLIGVSTLDRVIVAVAACFKLGLTCVPMDPSRSLSRIPRRAGEAECEAAILDPGIDLGLETSNVIMLGDETLDEGPLSKLLGPMHPAFIIADSAGQLFTLPVAGFLAQSVSAYKNMFNGAPGGDTLWLATPAHYASYLSSAFGALLVGGSVGSVPLQAMRDTSEIVKAVDASDAKLIMSDVKTLVKACGPAMEKGERPEVAGPDVLVIDGEIVEPRLWSYLRGGLFDGETHVVQMLSRPESGGFVAGPNIAVTPVRSSSVSLAAPGFSVKVVQTNGRECDIGEGGLIALEEATPGMAIELQDAAPPINIQVKARRDQAGYLWPMGEVKLPRAKTKGVAIPELEAMIVSITGVEMAAVIRHQDPNGSKKIRAFVQPSGDPTGLEQKIRERIVETFGEKTVPDRFRLVKQLPYGRTGKLLRSVLRRYAEGQPLSSEDMGVIGDDEVIDEIKSD